MDRSSYLNFLSSTMWKQRQQNILCDTTIITANKDLFAHSVVLAAGSSVFKSEILHNISDQNEYRLDLRHLNSTQVETLLELMYKGECTGATLFQNNDGLKQICRNLKLFWTNFLSESNELSGASIIKKKLVTTEDNNLSDRYNHNCNDQTNYSSLQNKDENSGAPSSGGAQNQFTVDPGGCNNVLITNRCLDDFSGTVKLENPDDFDTLHCCPICNIYFDDIESLRKHAFKHAGISLPHPCGTCGQVLTRANQSQHKCDDSFFLLCRLCGQGFSKRYYLNKHMIRHVKRGANQHECEKCNKCFLSSTQLNRHICKIEPNENLAGGSFVEENSSISNEISSINDVRDDKLMIGEKGEATNSRNREEQTSTIENGNSIGVIKYACSRKTNLLKEFRLLEGIGKPNFECGLCGAGLSSINKLKEHMFDHRYPKSNGCYVCFMCDEVYNEKPLLLKHLMSDHETETYNCNLCNKNYMDHASMMQHHLDKHGTGASNVEPPAVNTSGFDQPIESVQLSTVEIRKIKMKEKEEIEKIISRNKIVESYQDCESRIDDLVLDDCNTIVASNVKQGLIIEDQCSSPGDAGMSMDDNESISSDRRELLPRESKVNIKFDLKCQFCDRSFTTILSFLRHSLTHDISTDGCYVCFVCDVAYKERNNLLHHLALDHSQGTNNTCFLCNKKCGKLWDLKKHLINHTTLMPYKCTLCEQSFRENYHFQRHLLRVHSIGKTPLNCNLCKRSFKEKYEFKRHFWRVHTKEQRKRRSNKQTSDNTIEVNQEKRLEPSNNLRDEFDAYAVFSSNIQQMSFNGTRASTVLESAESTITTTAAVQEIPPSQQTKEWNLKCRICEESFSGNTAFLKHTLEHEISNDGCYVCFACDVAFKERSSLLHHLALDHMESMGNKCYSCNRLFDTLSHLRKHLIVHTALMPYSCDLCGRSFRESYHFKRHLKRIHSITKVKRNWTPEGLRTKNWISLKSGIRYTCELCSTTFRSSYMLDKHKRRTIAIPNAKSITGKKCVRKCEATQMPMPRVRKVPEGCSFTCDQCGRLFRRAQTLRDHLKIHSGERPFECELCGHKFRRGKDLNQHRRIHTDEKVLLCPHCGKKFLFEKYLRSHVRTNHGTVKIVPIDELICEWCSKIFNKKSTLLRHQRNNAPSTDQDKRICVRVKTAVDPTMSISCGLCGKLFQHKSSLHGHMLIHTGERPYECQICSRRYRRSGDLRIHERTHTGERQHLCTYCGASFSRKIYMRHHIMAIHTHEKPYICDICGKSFSLPAALTQHRHVHLDEKNYLCPECPRRFSCWQNLYRHKQTHSNVKRHVCKICSRAFLRKANMRSHMKIHRLSIPEDDLSDMKEYEIKQEAAVDEQEAAFDEQEVAVDEQEAAVDEQEAAVDEQEAAVNEQVTDDEQELTIDEQELTIDEQEAGVDEQELIIDEQELTIDEQEVTVDEQEVTGGEG